MTIPNRVNRRTALAGTVGAALAAVAISPRLLAQEATTTPTPDEDGESPVAESAVIERATNALDIVRTDLAAVAGQIDTTMIDDLVSRASEALGRATADTSESNRRAVLQPALVSLTISAAAATLIRAGISTTPLPSQEGISSHVLAHVHGEVDRISAEAGASADAEVASLLATSRDLYASAYQQFNDGQFGQALRTGESSLILARAARLGAAEPGATDIDLFGEDEGRWLGGRRRARERACDRAERRRELFTGPDGNIIDFREPTDVPEPDFSN